MNLSYTVYCNGLYIGQANLTESPVPRQDYYWHQGQRHLIVFAADGIMRVQPLRIARLTRITHNA